MFEMRREYALYKGENLIASGSIAEIAKIQGVKPATISFYGSPTYQRRGTGKNRFKLISLNDDPMRVCDSCNEEKSLTSFYRMRGTMNDHQRTCMSCVCLSKNKRVVKPAKAPSKRDLEKMAWHKTLRLLA